jgi:hypothetical protein
MSNLKDLKSFLMSVLSNSLKSSHKQLNSENLVSLPHNCKKMIPREVVRWLDIKAVAKKMINNLITF